MFNQKIYLVSFSYTHKRKTDVKVANKKTNNKFNKGDKGEEIVKEINSITAQ